MPRGPEPASQPCAEYSVDCPDCVPKITDGRTWKELPRDHPVTIKAAQLLREASPEVQRAWHRINVLCIHDTTALMIQAPLMFAFGDAYAAYLREVN